MHFRDRGIIIAKRPLKENSAIITLFTELHGLYSGVVKESKKHGSVNQEGNMVDFFWQSRLHEHLGMAKCELIKAYSSFLITDKIKLHAFNSLISLIKIAFHERDSHNNFFPIFADYINNLSKNFNFTEYIKVELAILRESGYGLDLNECAVTGSKDNLHYISPKTGRAVCKSSGEAYHDKLLMLPQFLISDVPVPKITNVQKQEAFNLTTYFFNRYFSQNNKLPPAREVFITLTLAK